MMGAGQPAAAGGDAGGTSGANLFVPRHSHCKFCIRTWVVPEPGPGGCPTCGRPPIYLEQPRPGDP
eukprot:5535905-Alexandrium_andersonii.AAC.1